MNALIPIIKVVGNACNLRCKYCFYHQTDQRIVHVMENELLERIIAQVLQLSYRNQLFIWHGGEPLLAGMEFFEQVVESQKKYKKDSQVVENGIQTNGILINKTWASFLRANKFDVSLSIDGTSQNHNSFRKDVSGRGSFQKVLNALEILRSQNIEPGVIQVITAKNTLRARENFCFFVESLGIKKWSIIPYFDPLGENKDMTEQSVTNEMFTAFLKAYLKLWLNKDDPTIKIQEIEDFLCGIWGKRASLCSFSGTCSSFICIDQDGKVYPCDGYLSNDPAFALGDLSKITLSELMKSRAWCEYVEQISYLPPECQECKWRDSCHNGCFSQRVGGYKSRYYYCETRKKIFSYIENLLQKRGLKNLKRKGGDK